MRTAEINKKLVYKNDNDIQKLYKKVLWEGSGGERKKMLNNQKSFFYNLPFNGSTDKGFYLMVRKMDLKPLSFTEQKPIYFSYISQVISIWN